MSEESDKRSSIRPARTGEAALLTDLALRSKGYWEYDAAFLQDCRADLTVTPDYVASHPVFVIEEQGNIIGFYSLEKQADLYVELVHLFIEPAHIGGGHGKRLWQHAVRTAAELGFREMVISSDPFAEAFYKAMGAQRVGQTDSKVRAGRHLPLMRFKLALSSATVL